MTKGGLRSQQRTVGAGFRLLCEFRLRNCVAAVGEISELGRLENESQSGEDVTREHADVRLG